MSNTMLYKKTVNNFSKAEWLCLALTLGFSKEDFKGLKKESIIRVILTGHPKVLESSGTFYYFKSNSSGISMIPDEPENKSPFNEARINYAFHLSDEKLNEISTKEETKDEEAEPATDDQKSQVSDIEDDESSHYESELEKITGLIENLSTQTNSKVSKLVTPKVKYDSNIEIRRFLGQIETYAAANGIHTDANLIAIALAAMDQSDEGSLVKETLEENDYKSWSLFKTKLIRLLGHTEEYYRNYFQTFKRGSMRIGLALSCLTQAFKRGWNIDRQLTKLEEDMILSQFVNSLDGPLKVLLKSEIKKLNFSSVTERALELEACLGKDNQINALSLGPNAVDQINAIQPQSTQLTELIALFKQQHAELMKVISQSDSNRYPTPEKQNYTQRNKRPYQKFQRKPLSREQKTLLGNMCITYVKGRECSKQNCKWDHQGRVTNELKDALNIN